MGYIYIYRICIFYKAVLINFSQFIFLYLEISNYRTVSHIFLARNT